MNGASQHESTGVEGGASIGMKNGEHRTPDGRLDGQKYYVIGRARYRALEVAPNPANMLNVMPLMALDAFAAMRQTIRAKSSATWATVRSAFCDAHPEAPAGPPTDRKALSGFVHGIWAPRVKATLEAHQGFVSEGQHTPLLDSGGYFCFDVKLCKLMKRRDRTMDQDINYDITRVRAIEVLRILRTKFAELPEAFRNAFFRGPADADGNYNGIPQDAQWPLNDRDEPYATSADDDFTYAESYGGPDRAPTWRVVEKEWGLVLLMIKPGREADADAYEFGPTYL